MINVFKNIRERSDRAKFLCLGYKTNNWRKKKRGPKTATTQNIGAASAAPAAPLPTSMSKSPFLAYFDHMSIKIMLQINRERSERRKN